MSETNAHGLVLDSFQQLRISGGFLSAQLCFCMLGYLTKTWNGERNLFEYGGTVVCWSLVIAKALVRIYTGHGGPLIAHHSDDLGSNLHEGMASDIYFPFLWPWFESKREHGGQVIAHRSDILCSNLHGTLLKKHFPLRCLMICG